MDAELFLAYAPALASGLGVTALCWVTGSTGALLLGLAVACSVQWGGVMTRRLLASLTETIRGIPLLIQLFLLYYGLPELGLVLEPLEAGVLGFALYGSPYYAEVFRAGFQSVPRGHIEAGRCIALSEATILRRIILPHMLVSITAPLTNVTIILIKETAVLSVITVPELLYETQSMASETFHYAEPFLALALCYWGLVELTAWLGRCLEKRMTRHMVRPGATTRA
ncbi:MULTISPECIES: amino acid ABC transporter permease [unclassified Haematospirillum]|uniref:amino acid ABC transporter permease n=1 Tax=unclassified Haematospirillum TaxID=2622088 RepID=UPI00143C5655|nr:MULTISPECIES: amino acid ABC transporter permease [unclassified Haematospirillum]NKD54631.1 amino acid ABC transporter permease [Haematospirillum sp. H4890]NKD74757.1 amino acid ABC transporter permease [Haematospirillum sp. H4485]NKD87713.1 amino acid ABC transporter permease [Haematospirillum sp. 15-248]